MDSETGDGKGVRSDRPGDHGPGAVMPSAEDIVRAELRAETAALKAALAPLMGKLAVALCGRPTGRLRHELRFRRKGSLGVV
ncbi:hypothetical protein, partial [Rhodoplanes sp. SY1]|uniref:hypothetical protein n=1 Tax=Rhodoplanes sp. SY1 TaxID=3166646 RepID=UPI0038B633E8